MSAKHRITVNLEGEEYEALQKLAARTDRSLAWLGRRAIRDFIIRKRESDNPTADLPAEITSNERRTT